MLEAEVHLRNRPAGVSLCREQAKQAGIEVLIASRLWHRHGAACGYALQESGDLNIALMLRTLAQPRPFRPDIPSMQYDKLIELLQSQQARFRVIEHTPQGRSELVARIRGTAPGQGAKAMLCKSKNDSGELALVVLPGDRKLDFRKVAEAAAMKKATLASPEEAMEATGCVIGAIPPFTDATSLRLVVDPELVSSYDEIAFNAGRLDRSIVLNTQDYLRIARPAVRPVCS
jgi:Ala-tRNA(Pro) deacylase